VGTSQKDSAGIQSVEVGFELLAALTRSACALSLKDLSAACGMSPAKAHRYLASFQRLGLVVQDAANAQYDLGPQALSMGLSALARVNGVKLARERLVVFKRDHSLTVAVAVWGNRGPTFVHWDDAPQAVTVNLRLGDVMPLLTSATGQCFLSFGGAERVELVLRTELSQTKAPRSAANAIVAKVRKAGLAEVRGSLLPGIWGMAAPVFDANGHLTLALVSVGALAAHDKAAQARACAALKHLAAQLSHDLGHRAG
jgi:DNA-binding IclR family transcriptional regulator